MGGSGRLFVLEMFGEVCSKIGYFLLRNKETKLGVMNREIGISRADLMKGLSLLIHFQIVGFTNYAGKGTRYFIRHGINPVINYPVYVDYAEKVYGVSGAQIMAQLLIRRRISENSISNELSAVFGKMVKDGIIAEEHLEGVKRVKEESGRQFVFPKKQVDRKIVFDIFCRDVLRHFSENTKKVFCAVRSFHPSPSSLHKLVERCRELGVQSENSTENSTESGFNELVRKNLKYLMGYEAVSGSYEMYQINQEVYLDKIKRNCLLDYCEVYFGPTASAVLSMLLTREYVEDKFVQKYMLIESSECKKVLFSLLSEGLVSLQVIPRTADCAPSKSFHLWSAVIDRTVLKVKQKVFERLNRTYNELFDLEKDRMLVHPSEYREKTESLFCSMERLHEFLFVLGMD